VPSASHTWCRTTLRHLYLRSRRLQFPEKGALLNLCWNERNPRVVLSIVFAGLTNVYEGESVKIYLQILDAWMGEDLHEWEEATVEVLEARRQLAGVPGPDRGSRSFSLNGHLSNQLSAPTTLQHGSCSNRRNSTSASFPVSLPSCSQEHRLEGERQH
jgi:hypothetical protein